MEKREKDLMWMVKMLIIGFLTLGVLFAVSLVVQENDYRDLEELNNEAFRELEYEFNRADSLQSELDSLHTLSWENVEYWIDTLGIDHPEVVKQQVMLETGALTSTICHENNNLFGMKEPRIRETTALGTKRGHSYYGTYIDSIKDYKLWQDNMYGGGDYYAFLNRVGYAEARYYITALKNI